MFRKKRILILGASGMLGSALLRWFSQNSLYEVFGSLRNSEFIERLQKSSPTAQLIAGVDVRRLESLSIIFDRVQPDVVINCIGIIKQLKEAEDYLLSLSINSLLPHQLAKLSQEVGARLIHFSTDCVFSGVKGSYLESDFPDANDLYGRSKLLGETNYSNSVTLRTSIIGHELSSKKSLIEWFLSQEREVKGYKEAIFSGLPTVEIARIIHEFVIPNSKIQGLYHLSADPISKFDLLSIVAKFYKKNIKINSDTSFVINRSLNSERFRYETGFLPDSWDILVERMNEFH